MKPKYLSYAQACAMRRDYQHLIGDNLDDSHQIEQIVIVPYSRILQWQFCRKLLFEERTQRELLSLDYGGRYDVIALTRADGEPGFMTIDLRRLLAQRGISYDAARYACLRTLDVPSGLLWRILQ